MSKYIPLEYFTMNAKYQTVRHVKIRSADERKGYTRVFKRLALDDYL